jgi:hypothetical protein
MKSKTTVTHYNIYDLQYPNHQIDRRLLPKQWSHSGRMEVVVMYSYSKRGHDGRDLYHGHHAWRPPKLSEICLLANLPYVRLQTLPKANHNNNQHLEKEFDPRL